MTLDPQESPLRLRDDPHGPPSLREALGLMGAGEAPPLARARMASRLGLKPPPAAPPASGSAMILAKVGLAVSIAGTVGAIAWWMQRPPVIANANAAAPAEPALEVPAATPPSESAPWMSVPSAPAPRVISVPPVTLTGPAPGNVGGSAKGPRAPLPADVQPNEAALLREAGGALRDGNPGRALELVDELASRFPNGTFGQERDVLRIDALLALGRSAEARDRARVFLAAHPESAHRTRLEEVLTKP